MKRITQAAYLRELEEWGRKLTAELAALRPRGREPAQSLAVDLQAELFRYQKEQERLRQSPETCDLSLQHYEMFARRYYFLLREVEKVQAPERTRRSGWSSASRPQKKGYLNETYCSRKGAQPPKQKKSRTASKFAQQIEPEWISGLIKRYSAERTALRGHREQFALPDEERQPFRHGEMRELSNQLLELRRVMRQLQEQVEGHGHEDYESQIAGLRENNRRLTAELTVLREENNSILSMIQQEEHRRSRRK